MVEKADAHVTFLPTLNRATSLHMQSKQRLLPLRVAPASHLILCLPLPADSLAYAASPSFLLCRWKAPEHAGEIKAYRAIASNFPRLTRRVY